RGDISVNGVNFSVAPPGQGTSPFGRQALSGGDASGTDLGDPAVRDALFAETGGGRDRFGREAGGPPAHFGTLRKNLQPGGDYHVLQDRAHCHSYSVRRGVDTLALGRTGTGAMYRQPAVERPADRLAAAKSRPGLAATATERPADRLAAPAAARHLACLAAAAERPAGCLATAATEYRAGCPPAATAERCLGRLAPAERHRGTTAHSSTVWPLGGALWNGTRVRR